MGLAREGGGLPIMLESSAILTDVSRAESSWSLLSCLYGYVDMDLDKGVEWTQSKVVVGAKQRDDEVEFKTSERRAGQQLSVECHVACDTAQARRIRAYSLVVAGSWRAGISGYLTSMHRLPYLHIAHTVTVKTDKGPTLHQTDHHPSKRSDNPVRSALTSPFHQIRRVMSTTEEKLYVLLISPHSHRTTRNQVSFKY